MIFRKTTSKEEINEMAKAGKLTFAGASSTKIYGEIRVTNKETSKKCGGATSLIKSANADQSKSTQVFFVDEIEALEKGYRPCKSCLTSLANEWENAVDKKAWAKNRIDKLRAEASK
ncbi:MAG TPA: hypothetical protein PK239_14570 [Chitinophagales bacterium]|nr:hypothetical protein [Chitinophagales bacterium]